MAKVRKTAKAPTRPAGTAASDVDAAGASAGQAGTGADAAGAAAQQETGMDIGQAESSIAQVLQSLAKTGDLHSVEQTTLGGFMSLGLIALKDATALSNRVNNNAVTFDESVHGVMHAERERTTRMGDQTGTIRISDLAELAKGGFLQIPEAE